MNYNSKIYSNWKVSNKVSLSSTSDELISLKGSPLNILNKNQNKIIFWSIMWKEMHDLVNK